MKTRIVLRGDRTGRFVSRGYARRYPHIAHKDKVPDGKRWTKRKRPR